MTVRLQRLITDKKDPLFLGKDQTQGLEHKLSAEKCIQLILLKITKSSV